MPLHTEHNNYANMICKSSFKKRDQYVLGFIECLVKII